MEDSINRKDLYNPESIETLNERRMFGGNPDGMLNFTKNEISMGFKCVGYNGS